MSSGGERHSGDCQHGHLYDWCRKGGPCRIEELEREVATLRAERDAAVAEDRTRAISIIVRWLATMDMRLPLAIVMDIRRGD